MVSLPTLSSRRRLARLIETGRCKVAEAPDYADELKRLAHEVADMNVLERQGRVFKALGDETRLRVLNLLGVREMCVCEIMVALDLTQPTASHHLGILERAGLVKARKEGKWVFYRLTDPKLLARLHILKTL